MNKQKYSIIRNCDKCGKEDAINIYSGFCCSCDENEPHKRPINKDSHKSNIKPLPELPKKELSELIKQFDNNLKECGLK